MLKTNEIMSYAGIWSVYPGENAVMVSKELFDILPGEGKAYYRPSTWFPVVLVKEGLKGSIWFYLSEGIGMTAVDELPLSPWGWM